MFFSGLLDYFNSLGASVLPCCYGPDRATAIARMREALDEFDVGPIRTTIPMHRRLMDAQQFIDADFDIHYVERWLEGQS